VAWVIVGGAMDWYRAREAKAGRTASGSHRVKKRKGEGE